MISMGELCMGDSSITIGKIRIIYKNLLKLGAVIILEAYWLWLLFMHMLWDLPYQKWILAGAKVLAIAAVIYVILSAFTIDHFPTKALDTIKRFCSPEWVILFLLLVWYYLVCMIREKMDGIIYYTYNRNRIFIMILATLIAFPFMELMGGKRGKKYIRLMMHIMTATFTPVSAWAVWKFIHLEFVTFPSGNQIDNYKQTVSLMMGNNRNTTGASAFFMLSICLYMFMTQNRKIRIAYIPAAVVHFLVLILSNSRTAYVGYLAMTMFTITVIAYKSQKQNDRRTRIALGLSLAMTFGAVNHFVRNGILTKYKYIPTGEMPEAFLNGAGKMIMAAGQAGISLPGKALSYVSAQTGAVRAKSLAAAFVDTDRNLRGFTNISGRPEIWISSIKLMFSSPDKFFLGVTPVYVRKGMAEYGGLTRDMPDAHNGILQVGASLGVPAMILFIVFEVMIIIRCIRLLRVAEIRKSANTWVIVPVIFSIMMMDLTEVRTFAIYRAVLLLFYLFAGWAVYLDKRRREKRVNNPNR